MNRRYALPLLLSIFVFTGIACVTSSKIYREKGLVTGEPGMNTYMAKEPGETVLLAKPYDGAPPLIPHSVKGLSIDLSQNECIDCHLEGMEIGEGHGATKIPPSHFTNAHTGERKEGQVVGIRYNCLQCHVHQSKEDPPYIQGQIRAP